MSNFRILNCDVIAGLKQLDENSIDCVVTSPPYWRLRDYGVEGQIGLEKHPKEYIEKMVEVFREVKRVLKPEGSVWLNVGDTYYGGSGCAYDGSNKIGAIAKVKNQQGRELHKAKSEWLQPKQKLLMPHRLAIAMQEDGWVLRNDVVWHKPSHMPSSVKDRLTNSFEYLFHFVQKRKYYYDLDAIREPHAEATKQRSKYGVGSHKWDESSKESGFNPYKNFKPSHVNFASGKNPADVWKYGNTETEALHRQGLFRGRENEVVEIRPLLPSQKDFVDKLREKFTIKEIIKKTGLPKTLIEHWFRYDESGFAFPSKEDWGKVGTDLFKKELTTIELKPAYIEANESGKNPSDFWSINPKPYPEAHFAVFPPELVRKPLLATCPKQICKKCGKVRKRIIKSYGTGVNYSNNSNYERQIEDKTVRHSKVKLCAKKETLGFSDCKCGKGWKAGTVLDPFCGSGTTLMEAQQQGKNGIGIEINPEYIKLIKKRLSGHENQARLFGEIEVKT